jgi:chromosome segregation ATPase
MSEVNYNETVVIPFLQKKFQELVNNNLVLEVNLMVEQNKNKDLTEKFNNITQNFALEISKRDDLISEYKGKYNQLQSESPIIGDLHSKIEELTNIANDRANTISINRSSIKEQQAIIDELNKQLNTAKAEIEVLKTPPSKKKKTQPKDDILDGDVF